MGLRPMRIVSLLPSLTELVAALGHADDLVGVTHECDFPPGVERLPHLTRSLIPPEATSAAIDAKVTESGGSLYELDGALLAELRPDLVLTQTQCDVCAVNEDAVRRVASSCPARPASRASTRPTWPGSMPSSAASATCSTPGRRPRLSRRFRGDGLRDRQRRRGRPDRRVLVLEWLDPPFSSGHWNPEIIRRAGGIETIGRPGERLRRLSWDEVSAARPEALLLSPCGFTLERTEAEWSDWQVAGMA